VALKGNVTDIIKTFLEAYKKALVDDQVKKGMRASGKSAQSLRVEVKGFNGKLTGTGYWVFQEEGRRPGNMPPVADIERWIKAKGLTLNPYAVAKSIANKGTLVYQGKRKGIDVSKSTKKPLNTMLKQLANYYGALVLKTMKDQYKTLNEK